MINSRRLRHKFILLSILMFFGWAFFSGPPPALAADAPSLGTAATFGVLASTYTNTVAGTTINGDLGYTIGPAVVPTVNGTTYVADATYNQAGIDQGTALANLLGQPCTDLGPGALNLNDVDIGSGPGVFIPGCYFNGGAMNITTGTTVTLNGFGVYIFRPGGALTTEANTGFVLLGDVCESDVFWAPVGAATIGANTDFVGNILDPAGITIGHFANLAGRALAFGGTVTTDANTITVPPCAPVPPPGGVTIGKDFNPSTIYENNVSTLTITLSNNNPGIATLNVDLIDNLPGGVVVAPIPNASTTCGGTALVTAIAGSSTVTLSAGSTIPAGTPGTCTVTVNVTGADDGIFINTIGIGALSVTITGGGVVSNTAPAIATLTILARLGDADDVPGTDVVIPLICEKDGTMNTLWAVGDLFANGAADILVYDRRSELVYDDFEEWTSDAPDVVVSDCQTLVAGMSVNQRAALQMSIGDRTYYVGYLVYFNVRAFSDQFIPWVYLVDLTRGFASGYNGFSAEGGVDLDNLAEGLGLAPVTATALFPRYYIGNDNAETWNWWITLLGSNDSDRILAGFICNEEEDCVSLSIPIPDELNIIDVEPYVPAGLHADYPKAGMGIFSIVNGDDQDSITTLGWSYQRLEASTVSASWDVIHPMHRVYFDIRN